MSQHGALHARRRRQLLACLLVGAVALLVRGVQVQVLQAAEWEGRATRQQRETVVLPAERGAIYDRNGIPLAATREVVRVALAPREVKDRPALAVVLRETLGLSRRAADRALDPDRAWVVLPGRYEVTARRALQGTDGVYLERVLERFRPHGHVAEELLGSVARDGHPLGGLEVELDSLLRGQDGTAVVRRDARGDAIPGALIPVREARPGHSVRLTIDLGLQEIAEQALRDAVAEHDAAGGDLIFADPRTGEILAAASHRVDGGGHWRAATDPYEPGSTMKPFVLAALLERGRAALTDTVFAENGHYRTGARTISDVHGYGWLTAGEVLRHSSNIGMVKLAARLAPGEQYEALRDFGFGTPTGVAYPSESSGRLALPSRWSGYSQASIAMGYEVSVTPLQMIMAYGALANGGRLMEPRVVREVLGSDGFPVRAVEGREIRRPISTATATRVAGVLADVVEEGTGRGADLGDFHVAGKTGTAWMFDQGSYQRDTYTASFAGFFPARDPQLVFLVKLDRGTDYGGSVAAPVTRATLAAALAARNSPLDRRAVVATAADTTMAGADATRRTGAGSPIASARNVRSAPVQSGEAEGAVFRLDAGVSGPLPISAPRLTIPDVVGMNARDAAAALHAAGLGVRVVGTGRVQEMAPMAGAVTERGDVVRLTLGRSR